MLHAQEDRAQVHRDHPIEVLIRKISKVHGLELDRGRIHREIKTTELRNRGLDHRRDVIRLRDVSPDEDRLTALLADERGGELTTISIEVSDHHARASGAEGEGE